MKKIGFVGLGRMGKSMALNLARKGFELAVFDINPAPMQSFTEFNKCRQAVDANDAIKDTNIAITVLPGPKEVEAVVLGSNGIIENLPVGSIIMDQSTVLPETSDENGKNSQGQRLSVRGCANWAFSLPCRCW